MSETLISLLVGRAERSADAPFLQFMENGEVVQRLCYSQALALACRWADVFRAMGLRKREPVFLSLPNTSDYPAAFFGTLLASGVPASAFSLRGRQPNRVQIENLAWRMKRLNARFLVLPPELEHLDHSDGALRSVADLQIVTRHDLRGAQNLPLSCGDEDDLALFQFTSGTSGDAKAVQLTHKALVAQANNINQALGLLDPQRDSGVSWLPLYHDMGLIGFLLTPMFIGGRVTLLRTEEFMLNPRMWTKAISCTQATITGGPPSSYAISARAARAPELEELSLQSLRIALVGAEVISRDAMEQFAARFASAGFKSSSFVPCYGLAENGLAVTVSPVGEGVRFDVIDRDRLHKTCVAQAPLDTENARVVASVGAPIPQTEVRIVANDGQSLEERHVGEIMVRSPSVMQGYFNDAEASSQSLQGGWLRTGDLGYLAGGRLFVTGRRKELLIVGGINYNPEDLEECVQNVQKPRMRTAAISVFDSQQSTESIVILVETVQRDHAEREQLRQKMREELRRVGYPVQRIVFVPVRSLPLTSSGKLKRAEGRERYLAGEFDGVAPK